MLIHCLRVRSEWLIDRLVGGAGGRTARKLREHEFWRTHPEEYAMLVAKAERLRRGREKHKRSVAAALAGMRTRCAPAQRVLFLFLSDEYLPSGPMGDTRREKCELFNVRAVRGVCMGLCAH